MPDWRDCRVSPGATIRAAMQQIEDSELRIAVVTAADDKLRGVVTDGDIRRGILDGLSLEQPVADVMNEDPVVVRRGSGQDRITQVMTENRVHQVPVVDAEGKVVRLETIGDLVKQEKRTTPVVIMAGGLGTRLRPITSDRPKPLVEVKGVPILETLLERLAAQGFRRIYLSVNYEAEMIQEHFEDGSSWGLQIEYLREEKRLGTAGPLSLLPKRPTEPVLVLNGDLLTTLDFGRLMDFHGEQGAVATMGVRRYQTEIPYGVAEIEDRRITGFEEKPSKEYFVSSGIYALEPEALKKVPGDTFFDMPELFQLLVEEEQDVAAYPIQEYWRDIARREDLQQAQAEFSQVFDQ
ncbi:nucleotidyltransferase family protein [Salinibacter ruber]|uniref:nucleotidyltransferase family protein n=1 Tax=Salinibacter ruber TaxID=146919 RepID=UPI00161230F6|nr:nucleotidyltransferase family protein [Salinibacter ruber]